VKNVVEWSMVYQSRGTTVVIQVTWRNGRWQCSDCGRSPTCGTFACPTWCVARSTPPQSRWRWRGVHGWSTHWRTSPARKAEDRSAHSTHTRSVHCHSPSAWLSVATTNNTGVKVHAALNTTPSLQEYSSHVARNLCLAVQNVFFTMPSTWNYTNLWGTH